MSPKMRSWLDDLFEYGRILSTSIIVYGVVRLMKWMNMPELFVDTVEVVDEVAAVLILTCFLGSAVRRAFAELVKI